jgi:hypothetical protein
MVSPESDRLKEAMKKARELASKVMGFYSKSRNSSTIAFALDPARSGVTQKQTRCNICETMAL